MVSGGSPFVAVALPEMVKGGWYVVINMISSTLTEHFLGTFPFLQTTTTEYKQNAPPPNPLPPHPLHRHLYSTNHHQRQHKQQRCLHNNNITNPRHRPKISQLYLTPRKRRMRNRLASRAQHRQILRQVRGVFARGTGGGDCADGV